MDMTVHCSATASFDDPPVSETRSRIMAAIRGRDTKPEIRLRKALHKEGFRYRTTVSSLPGKPDLVLPKYGSVVFVNGCFWHGHDCGRCRMPTTRAEYWKRKIERNMERDGIVREKLLALDWRVMTVWECQLREGKKGNLETSVRKVKRFLRGRVKEAELG